jgi:excinuclease ABC subunit A
LELPLRRLILITGVSGSGKSSLAFDTLFAEGQRRYVETFSAYTRQFLERMDRPDADQITGVPPAIAIRQRFRRHTGRSTVATFSELDDYLRLFFARVAEIICLDCGQRVRRFTPEEVAQDIERLPVGTKLLVAFRMAGLERRGWLPTVSQLRSEGFVRFLVAGRLIWADEPLLAELLAQQTELVVVVDRLTVGPEERIRLRDSVEVAFDRGGYQCEVWTEGEQEATSTEGVLVGATQLDGRPWLVRRYANRWQCLKCGRAYPEPDPRLYSSRSSLGACPKCNGFGDLMGIDESLVIPDPTKSLLEGAVAPWNTPLGQEELITFVKSIAPRYRIPVDVPYQDLDERSKRIIWEGVPERGFWGIRGMFEYLERKRYKMHVRVYLSRWRGYTRCPECNGSRLRPEALAARVGGKKLPELLALRVDEALAFLENLSLRPAQRAVVQPILPQVLKRLRLLCSVGLGYLTLDRPTRTLSSGELHRVALTRALSSGLVNTLYVLDEPSVGLHERDIHRLLGVIRQLCDQGNTVVVVEHDFKFLQIADYVVDLGPGAGVHGGKVVYAGPVSGLAQAPGSTTAEFLNGRRRIRLPRRRRSPAGWIVLRGARGNNLKQIDVAFPLRVLCVVTGVSGAGKSTLVLETLYPAVLARLGKAEQRPLPFDEITGVGQIEACVLVDPTLSRSSRSNPATYVKAFDEIRKVFASSFEARLLGLRAAHFSFNSPEGRCPECEGLGVQQIDMQFLAEITMTCPECEGRRFRKNVLQARYRGKTIADVLDMTVREAMEFFASCPNVVSRLEPLVAVGLDYLRLGQPCDTLSGGEAQRLKLASYMSKVTAKPTLLIFDEPTNGLHAADIQRLLDCFQALLDQGHSLLLVEHHMDVIKCADWIIDLGPEAGAEGGQVVVSGPPEEVMRCPQSWTGKFLREHLERAGELEGFRASP